MTIETTATGAAQLPPLLRSVEGVIDAPVLLVSGASERGPVRLAARERELAAIRSVLEAESLVRWRSTWASFSPEGVRGVDLVLLDPAVFGPVLDDLFRDATPLAGSDHLLRPAPHAVLLLEAEALIRNRLVLRPDGRRRVLEAGQDAAWRAARAAASTVRLRRALHLLERAVARPRAEGTSASPAIGARWRRPILVSLSGPDGSGKSTQVEELRRALADVGVEAGAAWAPTIARTSRRGGGGGRGGAAPAAVPAATGLRSAALSVAEHGWVVAVTVQNAAEMWRHVWRGRRQQVLLLDRFSLDAQVKFQYWYGHRRGMNLAFEQALFRVIAPRADVAVLLVVPTELNRARRPEGWTAEELQLFWGLYRDMARSLGAGTVDASRPVREVGADVATVVWQRLP